MQSVLLSLVLTALAASIGVSNQTISAVLSMTGGKLRVARSRCSDLLSGLLRPADRATNGVQIRRDAIEGHRNTDTTNAGAGVSQKIIAALQDLPPHEGAALFLRDVQQLPLAVVALKLGCSITKARLHIANGRVGILRCLEPRPPVAPALLLRTRDFGPDGTCQFYAPDRAAFIERTF